MLNCSCCEKMIHGMCAYLEGCSLQMKKGMNLDYKVEVNCCTDPELKKRLARQRGFKLNIEKQIFRESQNRELFDYIESQVNRSE